METIKIFNYNDAPVTFKLGDTTMVNATEMAKPFGKEVFHWFENENTHNFIHTLAKHKGLLPNIEIPSSLNTNVLSKAYPSLIKVAKGGIPGQVEQGTWMHEDVALEFARWLSPLFAIWCNDRIKELLRTGTTATSRYDASRNILPGVHSPEARMIGEHAIWTICIDNTLFYSLKDILNAAGMYEHKRKETSRNWFRSYVYWINDRTGTCPKRYINEAGVLFLFSRTRTNKGDPRARQFLGSFTRQARENEGKIKTARLENIRMEETNGEINLNEFLDIIISTQESKNRKFLYDLYNKLLTIRQPWKN